MQMLNASDFLDNASMNQRFRHQNTPLRMNECLLTCKYFRLISLENSPQGSSL
jgi:hypothetical protein